MVAPITGPITWRDTETNTATVQLRDKRVGYKQAPPFNLVTPYHASRCTGAKSATCSVSMLWDWTDQVGGWDSWQPLQNLAYERFKDQALGVQAQVGANIGEWRDSVDMIEKRALQLYRFTRAVKRLEFDKASKILRTKRPSTVSKAKGFGGNWLEYWLGWAPVIQDIYNAIDVLQGEPKPTHVRASASESKKTYWLAKDYRDNPNSSYPSYSWRRMHTKWICDRVIACGAEIQVVNNNLNMANNLGLVNAASIAWELVPFSFVIDWFVNVGDCLDTFTDFHGLTLSNEWSTVFLRGVIEAQDDYQYWWWEGYPPRKVYGGSIGQNNGRGTFAQMSRTYGLPKVGLVLRPFKGLSLTRGATAISLLLQGLRG